MNFCLKIWRTENELFGWAVRTLSIAHISGGNLEIVIVPRKCLHRTYNEWMKACHSQQWFFKMFCMMYWIVWKWWDKLVYAANQANVEKSTVRINIGVSISSVYVNTDSALLLSLFFIIKKCREKWFSKKNCGKVWMTSYPVTIFFPSPSKYILCSLIALWVN